MTACIVRLEQREDQAAIRKLHEAAFGRHFEARLVEVLRKKARPYLGLVALDQHGLLGHLLFTPVRSATQPETRLLGLAPMAIQPARQGQGLGTRLVKAGISAARDTGARAVVVLGDPGYYERFGFEAADRWGLHCAWEVPPGAFMAMALNDPGLDKLAGLVSYHAAFDGEGIVTSAG